MAIIAHYRAADIPGAIDGERVKVWPDISGNGHHLEASEGAIYRSTGFSDHPCLDFDRRLQNSYTSAWEGFGGTFTAYVTVQSRETNGEIISGGTGSTDMFHLQDRAGYWAASRGNTDYRLIFSNELPVVLSWSHDASDGMIAVSRRGSKFESEGFTSVNPLPLTPLRVGGSTGLGTARYLDGQIAEIVIYDEAHVGEVREQTSLALAEHYKFWASEWGPPHDMAGPLLPVSQIEMRRERIPAYQVAGVGDGDSDREVTEGQVWPR